MPTTPAVFVDILVGPRAEAIGLNVTVLAGQAGLTRPLTSPHIQKTGLALAGYDEYLHPGRVLVFGESEIRFLEKQTPETRRTVIRRAIERGVPCVLATAGIRPPDDVAAICEETGIALLVAAGSTGVTIARVTALLEDSLAERQIIHAVLMDILGLGLLITGESGIGKSECGLDLVLRGHRLVADDTVEVHRRAETILIGTCPELTRHHMELRGLGLVNVRELFGIASVRSSKRVEFVVQLERWESGREYERLGLDDVHEEILGVKIPMVRMPVAPGRSVATLVEVVARNQLLRTRGRHAARELARALEERLRRGETEMPAAVPPDDDALEAD